MGPGSVAVGHRGEQLPRVVVGLVRHRRRPAAVGGAVAPVVLVAAGVCGEGGGGRRRPAVKGGGVPNPLWQIGKDLKEKNVKLDIGKRGGGVGTKMADSWDS